MFSRFRQFITRNRKATIGVTGATILVTGIAIHERRMLGQRNFDKLWFPNQFVFNWWTAQHIYDVDIVPEKFRSEEMLIDYFSKAYPCYNDCSVIPEKFWTREFFCKIVKLDPYNVGFIPQQHITLEICNLISHRPHLLRHIPEKIIDEYLSVQTKDFFNDQVGDKLYDVTISGELFNKYFSHLAWVKITNSTENHNGYQFKTGLNVDTKEFVPRDNCDNGIHFTLAPYKWYHLYNCKTNTCWLRSVTIPNDALVTFGSNKAKASTVVLGEKHVHPNYQIRTYF